MKEAYEVLVIGAGPAGLSAALALGRLQRSVFVCDDRRPRNAVAAKMNNFPGRDGTPPAELRLAIRKDLEKYPTVELYDVSVKAVEKTKSGFAAWLATGESIRFKKILLAHGIEDRLPELPGFRELWGKSVFHCPYCHGFEHRGERLGLLGDGELALHMLPLLTGLTSDLVLFTNGPTLLTTEEREKIERIDVGIVETPLCRLNLEGERLVSVELSDGDKKARDGLFVLPKFPFQMKANFGAILGCEFTEMGLYKVDEMGRTTLPGVFAAGDIARPAHSGSLSIR